MLQYFLYLNRNGHHNKKYLKGKDHAIKTKFDETIKTLHYIHINYGTFSNLWQCQSATGKVQ